MLGIQNAEHAEYDPKASTLLITPVACPVVGRPEGAPKLSGKLKLKVTPDSLAYRIYQRQRIEEIEEAEEEFLCNFELNPAFQGMMEKGGLRLVGRGENGEVRIVELSGHRFFLATLFLPQLGSRKGSPHPLITAYLEAAYDDGL